MERMNKNNNTWPKIVEANKRRMEKSTQYCEIEGVNNINFYYFYFGQ